MFRTFFTALSICMLLVAVSGCESGTKEPVTPNTGAAGKEFKEGATETDPKTGETNPKGTQKVD